MSGKKKTKGAGKKRKGGKSLVRCPKCGHVLTVTPGTSFRLLADEPGGGGQAGGGGGD